EYRAKLRLLNGEIIPDPFTLEDGWLGETTGLPSWPSLYIMDIATFLNCRGPSDIVHRVMNEYKEGKAYRYFSCDWVKEILYHPFRARSEACLLKAKVTPSQSVNNKEYDVWVAIKKDTKSEPGGQIFSGYCTCTAGMLGCCNHITGLLFRVEHAVKTGATSASCTSKPCEWNIPSSKTTIKPIKVSDAEWTKSHYSKKNKACTASEDSSRQARISKNSFTPMTKQQSEELSNGDTFRKDLHEKIVMDIPDSCFSLIMEKRRMKIKEVDNCVLPISVIAAQAELQSEEIQNAETLLKKIQVNEDQVLQLKNATKDQAHSELWKEHRKARLTASNFKRICTRVVTLRKDQTASSAALVHSLMGYKEVRPTKAMKHGTTLEPVAKKAYVQEMKKIHKNFKAAESGLTLYTSKPFIGASADLEVKCDCCDEGLCEIKCPETIKNAKPCEENLTYISNGTLNENHQYFFQVQGQMGILDKKYCDLYIFTFHGNMKIRIKFDKKFWEIMIEKLCWFWDNCIIPEILKPMLDDDEIDNIESEEQEECDSSAKNLLADVNNNAMVPRSKTDQHTGNKNSRRKIKLPKRQNVYPCGKCGLVCAEQPKNYNEESINCDSCKVWYHFVCVGLKEVDQGSEWMCDSCKSED
ncbi:hypothetical protein FSP39_002441, partial [Pinctada imbricata]